MHNRFECVDVASGQRPATAASRPLVLDRMECSVPTKRLRRCDRSGNYLHSSPHGSRDCGMCWNRQPPQLGATTSLVAAHSRKTLTGRCALRGTDRRPGTRGTRRPGGAITGRTRASGRPSRSPAGPPEVDATPMCGCHPQLDFPRRQRNLPEPGTHRDRLLSRGTHSPRTGAG